MTEDYFNYFCANRRAINEAIRNEKSIMSQKKTQPADNEIWYWGEYYDMQAAIDYISNPDYGWNEQYIGPTLLSNEFDGEKWILTFDGPVTHLGDEELDLDKAKSKRYYSYPLFISELNGEHHVDCHVTKVELGECVTDMMGNAFYYVDTLEEVILPSSVERLGTNYECIDDCDNCHTVTFKGTKEQWSNIEKGGYDDSDYWDWNDGSVEEVICSDGVVSIPTTVLHLSNGEDVTIKGTVIKQSHIDPYRMYVTGCDLGDSVVKIEYYAFHNCYSLESIVIPNSVKRIGYSAFNWCTGLTSCTLSSSLEKIEYDTFRYCSNLTSIVIPDSVTSIGNYAFAGCSSLESITIPDSVIELGYRSFTHCTNLQTVVIGNSVTAIESYTFNGCYNLTNVTLGSSITNIGDYAFSYCNSLTSITIPDSVTEIGYGAFMGCYNLENVTISSSVTSIDSHAFYSCDQLTELTYEGTKSQWGQVTKGYYWCPSIEVVHCTDGDYTYLVTVTIDGSSIVLDKHLSYYDQNYSTLYTQNHYPYRDDINEYKINTQTTNPAEGDVLYTYCNEDPGFDSVILTLDNGDVKYIANKTSIVGDLIPESSYLYKYIPNIVSVEFTNKVTSVGGLNDAVFGYSYTKLNSITIETSTISIGPRFLPFNLSVDFYYNGVKSQWNNIDKNSYWNNSSIVEEVHCTDGDVSILPTTTFKYSDLTSSTSDNTVISQSSYNRSKTLTSVKFGGNVTEISSQAFSGCTLLTSLKIPGNITIINEQAFEGCSRLTNLTLLKGILEIGNNAFKDCTSLSVLNIPASITTISDSSFKNCGITSITVDQNNQIYYATDDVLFKRDNGDIYLILYPRANTRTSYTIPNGVTHVSNNSFYRALILTTTVCPDSLTYIGNDAFVLAYNVTSLTCKAVVPPTLGNQNSLPGQGVLHYIYVPAASVDTYKAASGWSTYANSIQADPNESN